MLVTKKRTGCVTTDLVFVVIYSPNFRTWFGLPLISKLGVVFNLNNNNYDNRASFWRLR